MSMLVSEAGMIAISGQHATVTYDLAAAVLREAGQPAAAQLASYKAAVQRAAGWLDTGAAREAAAALANAGNGGSPAATPAPAANPAREALSRAVNRALAEGAPAFVEIRPDADPADILRRLVAADGEAQAWADYRAGHGDFAGLRAVANEARNWLAANPAAAPPPAQAPAAEAPAPAMETRYFRAMARANHRP